jgi:hypothetical protein
MVRVNSVCPTVNTASCTLPAMVLPTWLPWVFQSSTLGKFGPLVLKL